MARAFGSASSHSSPADIVVIDDSSPLPKSTTSSKRKKTTAENPVVIDLDEEENIAKPSRKKPRFESVLQAPLKEVLTFSVSKNSGRITLHYKEQSKSSLVNFDVNDILTEETVDALTEVQTKRSNKGSSPQSLAYKHDEIQSSKSKLVHANHSFMACL